MDATPSSPFTRGVTWTIRWVRVVARLPLPDEPMERRPTEFDLENPTEEHRMLRHMVRNLVRDVVEPQADEYNHKGALNVGLMRKCGELGLLGITVPSDWGGAGMDVTASVLVHHELAKSDAGFTLAYLAHAVLFVNNFFWASND